MVANGESERSPSGGRHCSVWVFHHDRARKEAPTDLAWNSSFMMGIIIQSKSHTVSNYSGTFDTTNDACQLSVCVYFDVKISQQL